MGALTQQQGTRKKVLNTISLPLGASVKATRGGRACIDTSTKYCVPAAAGNGNLIPIGDFTETVDNSSGGAGALSALVRLDNEIEATWYDSVTGAGAVSTTVGGGSLFTTVYLFSDHEVTTSGSGNSVAGRVWDCNSIQGVLVQNILPADNTIT